MLSLNSVTFGYRPGASCLQNLSFHVRAGEFIGLVGPNGAGKSTVLKLACGLLHPDAGSVSVNGITCGQLSRRQMAQTVAYLPQDIADNGELTTEATVALGRFPHGSRLGLVTEKDRRVIDECMRRTEVDDLRFRATRTLSGGERQRVFLASVLAQEPTILLLDEPTTGLDLSHQVAFFSLLRELAEKGMAIVVVTHDLNLASLFCRELALLFQSQIVARGRPGEVLTVPRARQVFGERLTVSSHPEHGCPIILPT